MRLIPHANVGDAAGVARLYRACLLERFDADLQRIVDDGQRAFDRRRLLQLACARRRPSVRRKLLILNSHAARQSFSHR
jgi:hypothetical protein